MSRHRWFAILMLLLLPLAAHAQSKWMVVTSSGQWKKANTYVYLSVRLVIECETGRKCEAGTGLSLKGKPRGSRRTFVGRTEMTAYGIGALQVRPADGKGPVKVAFFERNAGGVPIYPPIWDSIPLRK